MDEVPKSSMSDCTQLGVARVFFSFIAVISQLRRPIELKFSQLCYFICEIHQVGRLVFENYQRCPVPLKGLYDILYVCVSIVLCSAFSTRPIIISMFSFYTGCCKCHLQRPLWGNSLLHLGYRLRARQRLHRVFHAAASQIDLRVVSPFCDDI